MSGSDSRLRKKSQFSLGIRSLFRSLLAPIEESLTGIGARRLISRELAGLASQDIASFAPAMESSLTRIPNPMRYGRFVRSEPYPILIRRYPGLRVAESPGSVQFKVYNVYQLRKWLRNLADLANLRNKNAILRIIYESGPWPAKDSLQSRLLAELARANPRSLWLQLENKLIGLTRPYENWMLGTRLFNKLFSGGRTIRLNPQELSHLSRLNFIRARAGLTPIRLELPQNVALRLGGVDVIREGNTVHLRVNYLPENVLANMPRELRSIAATRRVPHNLLDVLNLRGKHVVIDVPERYGWPHSDRTTSLLLNKAVQSNPRTIWVRQENKLVNAKGVAPGKTFTENQFRSIISGL